MKYMVCATHPAGDDPIYPAIHMLLGPYSHRRARHVATLVGKRGWVPTVESRNRILDVSDLTVLEGRPPRKLGASPDLPHVGSDVSGDDVSDQRVPGPGPVTRRHEGVEQGAV